MVSKLNSIERDARVTQLWEQLIEIEERLIPTGLHVFGRPSELKQKIDLFRMVASFDRPEHGAVALQSLVAEALNLPTNDKARNETTELIERIVRNSVEGFCHRGSAAAAEWLRLKGDVDKTKSLPMFFLLAKISEQLEANNEIDSLLRA